MTSHAVPFAGPVFRIPEAWIDVNGHMNATHYFLAIYEAHVRFTQALGLGDEYACRTRCGEAVIESHLCYEREVTQGSELQVISWVLAVDTKRLHFCHEMYNVTTGVRAAVGGTSDHRADGHFGFHHSF